VKKTEMRKSQRENKKWEIEIRKWKGENQGRLCLSFVLSVTSALPAPPRFIFSFEA